MNDTKAAKGRPGSKTVLQSWVNIDILTQSCIMTLYSQDSSCICIL